MEMLQQNDNKIRLKQLLIFFVVTGIGLLGEWLAPCVRVRTYI